MKKFLTLMLTLSLALSLCSCGSREPVASAPPTTVPAETKAPETVPPTTEPLPTEPEIVMEAGCFKIDGIFVNDSYQPEDGGPLRMVYLLYTVTANDKNLRVSSNSLKLTINGINEYKSSHFTVGKYLPSYYYKDYIEDVYIGSSMKMLATFQIPEGDLAPDRGVTLQESDIPGVEEIYFKTDEIAHYSSEAELAAVADPEGYADEVMKREPADEELANIVSNYLDGRYWEFIISPLSYHLEFGADNSFFVENSGFTNSGSYTVSNGYIVCTYDSNGYTIEIPYRFEGDEINLDVLYCFDVRENRG